MTMFQRVLIGGAAVNRKQTNTKKCTFSKKKEFDRVKNTHGKEDSLIYSRFILQKLHFQRCAL